jgi:hypothetical protein
VAALSQGRRAAEKSTAGNPCDHLAVIEAPGIKAPSLIGHLFNPSVALSAPLTPRALTSQSPPYPMAARRSRAAPSPRTW